MQTETSRLREPFSMVGIVADALRGTAQRKFQPSQRDSSSSTPRLSWLERLDSWLWRRQLREREAWLAQAQDVYELEQRLTEANRQVGSRFY